MSTTSWTPSQMTGRCLWMRSDTEWSSGITVWYIASSLDLNFCANCSRNGYGMPWPVLCIGRKGHSSNLPLWMFTKTHPPPHQRHYRLPPRQVQWYCRQPNRPLSNVVARQVLGLGGSGNLLDTLNSRLKLTVSSTPSVEKVGYTHGVLYRLLIHQK